MWAYVTNILAMIERERHITVLEWPGTTYERQNARMRS